MSCTFAFFIFRYLRLWRENLSVQLWEVEEVAGRRAELVQGLLVVAADLSEKKIRNKDKATMS